MPSSLIRLPEVQRRVGASRTEIYRRMDAGTFPRPVKIGRRYVAWVEEEIDTYVLEMIATHRKADQT